MRINPQNYLNNNVYMRSRRADLAYGLAKEADVIRLISSEFKCELSKTPNQYCCYDAEGIDMRLEIKSRRISSKTYSTTIIPVHKSLAKTDEKSLVFCFNFTDGIYYIAYDADMFSQFKISNISTWRDGRQETPKPHYEIPVINLKRISIDNTNNDI